MEEPTKRRCTIKKKSNTRFTRESVKKRQRKRKKKAREGEKVVKRKRRRDGYDSNKLLDDIICYKVKKWRITGVKTYFNG